MTDIKSTLIVGADTEGVHSELKALVRDVDSLGQAVDKAGESMGGFGLTTAETLKGADRQAKTLVNQIKTAALDIETAGKSLSDKFELKGLAKGIDPAITAPYIAALRQTEAAQAAVAAQAEATAAQVKTAAAEQAAAQIAAAARVKAALAEQAAASQAAAQKAAEWDSYRNLNVQSQVASAKQAAAATREVGTAAVIAGKHVDTMGQSAAQFANNMRSIPAQFTDIVVSLQGGQKPLTVLLQQGGQLKDMFGGVGNAVRATGTYLMTLINPFTLLAAAAAAIGYAFYAGSQEAKEYAKALTLTGNAVGLTAQQLQDTSASIAKASGSALSTAAGATLALARSNDIASESFVRIGTIAVDSQRELGVAVADTIKLYSDLGKDPVNASLKLNETTHYLTAAIFEQIKALEERGKHEEAGALAQATAASAAEANLQSVHAQLGYIDTALQTVTGGWKKFWSAAMNIGRPSADPLADLTAQIDAMKIKLKENVDDRYDPQTSRAEIARLTPQIRVLEQRKGLMVEQIAAADIMAGQDKKRNDMLEAQVRLDAEHDKYLGKAEKKERELARAKGLYSSADQTGQLGLDNAAKYAETLKGIEEKYKSIAAHKKTGNAFAGEQEAAKEWAKAMAEADKISEQAQGKLENLSKGQIAYRAYLESTAATLNDKTNPAMGELLKRKFEMAIEDEKAAALAKEQEKYLSGIAKASDTEVKNLDAKIVAQQLHNATIGQSAEQVEIYKKKVEDATTAELDGQADAIRALLKKNKLLEDAGDLYGKLPAAAKEAYEVELKGLDAILERRKKLSTEYGVGAERAASTASAKEATAEWKRGWEETDRIARDVFTTWATDGSNAAKKIGDTLKKALLSAIYEATLKPLVMQIYASVAGGGGASTALQAAAGGGGAGGGALGNLGALGGAFGSAFTSGFGATMGSFGSTIGLSIEGGLASIGVGTSASIASGLGSIAGALAPVGVGIAAVAALYGAMQYKVDAKGNGITATLGANGLPSGSVGTYAEFQQTGGLGGGGTTINREWGVAKQGISDYIAASAKSITETNKRYAEALGITSGAIDSFTKNIEVDLTGLDAAGKKNAIDAALSLFAAEQATAAYGAALAGVARDGETTVQTMQRLGTDFVTVNGAFRALGYELLAVGVEGANTASKLAQAFGGLGNFQAQTQALYQNFYSKDEQKASTINSVLADLKAAGVVTDAATLSGASRQNMRDAVDLYKTKTGTTEGDAQYAAVVTALNRLSQFLEAPAIVPTVTKTPATELAPAFVPAPFVGYTPQSNYAVDPAIAAAQAAIEAKAASVLNDQVSILKQTFTLTGDAAGLLVVKQYEQEQALKALDPSLHKIQIELWGLQDAAVQAAKDLQITNSVLGVQAQIAELTGDAQLAAAVKAMQHKNALDELNKVDPSGNLANLTTRLWDLQDAAKAAAAATAAAAAAAAAAAKVTNAMLAAIAKTAADLKTEGEWFRKNNDLALGMQDSYAVRSRDQRQTALNGVDPDSAIARQINLYFDRLDLNHAAQITSDYNRAMLEASGDSAGLAAFDRATKDAALLLSGWSQAQLDALHAQQDAAKAAAKAIDAMKTLATEIGNVAAFKGTIGASQQGIRSQMAGYDAVAYTVGQVAKYNGQLGAATTTSGRIEAGGKLQGAIVDRYNAELALINKNRDAASTAARAAFDAQTAASNAAISAQNTLNAAYRQIGDYAKSLLTGALSPFSGAEQSAVLQASYEQVLAGSRAGDVKSLGGLTGAADGYLNDAKLQAVSSVDYARVFGRAVNDLSALGGMAGTDMESVQRTFMFDSTAFDQQALILQTQSVADLQALADLTDVWTADLKTALNDQALAYVKLGLTTAQIAANTEAIGPGFELVVAAVHNAQTAQKNADALLSKIAALTAQVEKLTAVSQKTADNTATTAAVLDSATGGGGPMLVQTA